MRFNYLSLWWDDAEQTEITAAIDLARYGSPDASEIYPTSAVAQANETAFHFVNLFNASPLDYDVEFLFEANVPASIESVLSLGQNVTIAWSDTLLATIIALVIAIGVIAYFYKLVVSVAVVTTCTCSLTIHDYGRIQCLGAPVLLGHDHRRVDRRRSDGHLGLYYTSAISSAMKFTRGRSLKKANREAGPQGRPGRSSTCRS
ncbi:MAG: hypothetical protein MZU79_03050 [Anaerotruncus sp.]|nr:hypothetical protein [Anaerotruncus sp.]